MGFSINSRGQVKNIRQVCYPRNFDRLGKFVITFFSLAEKYIKDYRLYSRTLKSAYQKRVIFPGKGPFL